MIIQIGTEIDESRILWKHKESDEWKRADIDDLIEAYENRLKEPKPGDLISRQALIDEVLEDGNGAVLSYPAGMYEDDLVEHIEKQMIKHFIGVIEYAPPVELKQLEIIRCKNCRHDNNCEIQYAAQAGSEFFCGSAESKVEK